LKPAETIMTNFLFDRKQFASPNLPIVPPSIPAWQLTAHRQQQSDHDKIHKHDDHDDTGSGSGSSETEVVTKNSDSSLEIM
jgi:peroxin-14